MPAGYSPRALADKLGIKPGSSLLLVRPPEGYATTLGALPPGVRLEGRLRTDEVRLALLETGSDQLEAVRLYERGGYAVRGAFGGYPDNGLSVFYGKQLG